MEVLPGDLVEFAGPSAPVQGWPTAAEKGAVLAVDGGGPVRVVWESSNALVVWPAEWLRKLTDHAPPSDEGDATASDFADS